MLHHVFNAAHGIFVAACKLLAGPVLLLAA